MKVSAPLHSKLGHLGRPPRFVSTSSMFLFTCGFLPTWVMELETLPCISVKIPVAEHLGSSGHCFRTLSSLLLKASTLSFEMFLRFFGSVFHKDEAVRANELFLAVMALF